MKKQKECLKKRNLVVSNINSTVGISLITLVVTIIVIIILSGASILLLMGEEGVIKNAREAKMQSEIEQEKEIIAMSIMQAKIKNLGNEIIEEDLIEELDMSIGKNGEYSLKKKENDFIVTFEASQRSYKIDQNYDISIYEDIIAKINSQKDKYWQESISKGQHATNKNIGLDQNLNVVNMNNWKTTLIDNNTAIGLFDGIPEGDIGSTTGITNNHLGYVGTFESGKIIGNVPAYVLKAENEELGFLPVTSMDNTFWGCEELEIAPEIPSSVTSMESTFRDCKSLKTVSNIPSGVTNMMYTFSFCSLLETIPEIPSNVVNMRCTFKYCSNLKTVKGIIPSTVSDMYATFIECHNLTGMLTINVNENLKNCYQCFMWAATESTASLTIQSETSDLVELYNTKSTNSNITNLGKISN